MKRSTVFLLPQRNDGIQRLFCRYADQTILVSRRGAEDAEKQNLIFTLFTKKQNNLSSNENTLSK